MPSEPILPPTEPASTSRVPSRALLLLLAWVVIACALFLLWSPTPDAPAVDPRDQAIRDRMTGWAVRDAEQWAEAEGDLTIPWDEAEGHLAIVVDDNGRELELFEKLLALRFPLSFSILPDTPFAPGVQQRLQADDRRPREILLHLPMEPLEPAAMGGVEAGQNFLLASDSPEQLRAKVLAGLTRVPAARGVNNHMGSRLTADPEAMAVIMTTLAERELYFFDSRTTPKTVAATAAEAAGLPTISRKVFLDHTPGRAAIRSALAEAARLACDEPTAVIAHPSIELVEILSEDLPRLHEQNVGIYPLSRVIAGQRTLTASR